MQLTLLALFVQFLELSYGDNVKTFDFVVVRRVEKHSISVALLVLDLCNPVWPKLSLKCLAEVAEQDTDLEILGPLRVDHLQGLCIDVPTVAGFWGKIVIFAFLLQGGHDIFRNL